MIPIKAYLSKGRLKVEIALANGKQLHDKRNEKRKAIEKEEGREAAGRRRRSRTLGDQFMQHARVAGRPDQALVQSLIGIAEFERIEA